MSTGYRNQDGCHNCRYSFVKVEYDEPDEYYCTLGAGRRPRCGSFSMGQEEQWAEEPPTRFSKMERLWNRWAKKRRVEPWGICPRGVFVEGWATVRFGDLRRLLGDVLTAHPKELHSSCEWAQMIRAAHPGLRPIHADLVTKAARRGILSATNQNVPGEVVIERPAKRVSEPHRIMYVPSAPEPEAR